MPNSRVVYLHVGGHKTGTTYLQNVLWHNRDQLRRDGLLYPGEHPNSHIWACHDLRDASFMGYRAPQVDGAWNRLVDEVRAWDGAAIVDHEMFSLAAPEHVVRALEDLSFAEVRVVFTARDMARQLPAVWQEWVKNRSTLTFARFLSAVRIEGSDEAGRLWALHDVPAILAKWGAGLPPDRVRLVTVPPPGSGAGLLWQRFAAAIGIDPARYRTDVPDNSSLGAVEAGIVRRLNEQLGDVPQPVYDRAVKFHLAGELSRRGGPRIELPEDGYAWAVERAEAMVGALRAAGYAVTGDLAELLPAGRPVGADPDAVPAADAADAAIAGMAALVHLAGPPDAPPNGAAGNGTHSNGARGNGGRAAVITTARRGYRRVRAMLR